MADASQDVVSIDPTAAYQDGDFVLTGHASSPSGVASISLQGLGNQGFVSLGTTTAGADGSFSFHIPITGLSYSNFDIFEKNNSGVTTGFYERLALDGHWSGKPFVATEDEFTSIGEPTKSLYFRSDNSLQAEADYGANGSLILKQTYNLNGTSTTMVKENGATLQALPFDTIENHGAPSNTFVFDPGYGHDIVGQFRIGGNDHDSLSFKGADFGATPEAQLGSLLRDSHDTKGGLVITDPTSHDTVRLIGITKAQLVQNERDISFHA